MIGAGYCREMARYNAWQNKQLIGFLEALTAEELSRDRGAFFGSILGTASHLLWGDTIWMARFDGGEKPGGSIQETASYCADFNEWTKARSTVDGRISRWAASLTDSDLSGELSWYSVAAGRDVSKPMATCVVGFFNHQTHHRGQIHAMLTATGSKAPVSDLAFMPEEP